MSISAMKQALEALEEIYRTGDTQAFDLCYAPNVIPALRQAIAEAEKQEPVAIGGEWKPCVKLPIVVHVREQRKGETHVSTREGITPVKEDDLIMRGVAGEEYPIGRELFNRTYTFDTAPVHASDISQERVDETAKDRHEPYNPMERNADYERGFIDGRADQMKSSVDKAVNRMAQREWVGLDGEIPGLGLVTEEFYNGMIFAEDILREKNDV